MGRAEYGIARELQELVLADREVEPPPANRSPAIGACFQQVVTEFHNS
jgi:hypothetical protein